MVTAYHEAGHTVCAYLQDACDPPVSVSIIPRGLAGGVTAMSTGDDNFMQRSKAAAQLVSALGGRAAEELLLGGDYTQGACGDLTSATSLATAMATNYGMTTLGLMVRERSPYETSSPDAVTVVVEEMLMRARTEAITLLRKNITLLSAVADELLAEDTLDHLDLDRIYAACGSPGKVPATDTLLALYGASSTIAGEIEGVWDDASSSPSVRATPVA
jgi:cell division protease FtsH